MSKEVIQETKHITAIFDSKALYEEHQSEIPDNVISFVKAQVPNLDIRAANAELLWPVKGYAPDTMVSGAQPLLTHEQGAIKFPKPYTDFDWIVVEGANDTWNYVGFHLLSPSWIQEGLARLVATNKQFFVIFSNYSLYWGILKNSTETQWNMQKDSENCCIWKIWGITLS